jgi:hypothetical protein
VHLQRMPNPSLDVPQRFSFQHKVDPANAMTNENPVNLRATPIFM